MKSVRHLLTVASLAAVSSVMIAGPTLAGGEEKMTVCHVDGSDEIRAISIADPAFDSHIAHGDFAPGDDVPGEDATFGEDCSSVPNPPDEAAQALCESWGGQFVSDSTARCADITTPNDLAASDAETLCNLAGFPTARFFITTDRDIYAVVCEPEK